MVRKFHDHLPWERQSRAFAGDRLQLSPTTMWNQSRHVANLLDGDYEAIRKAIEAGFLRHADETRWKVVEGVAHKTQYVWLFRNQYHAYFTLEDSRSGSVAQRVLGNAVGVLMGTLTTPTSACSSTE